MTVTVNVVDALRVTLLNAELFEDENVYFDAIVRLFDPSARPAIPEAVIDVASSVTNEYIGFTATWGKLFKKYGQDLIETSALGFLVAVSEDWNALDRQRARELMDESLLAAQASRIRNGAEPITLDNVNNRLTIGTKALASRAPEGETLREYLFALPPHQRVTHVAPLLIAMGTGAARVKGRHVAAFEECQEYMWKIGVGLGLLDVMGEVPTDEQWAS